MNIENSPIYFAGSGNVAWHLANAFMGANLPVKGIWSRNKETAFQLSEKTNIPFINEELFFSQSGIFILAVNDDAIENLASRFTNKNIVLIHTAGSVPLNTLDDFTIHSGVFYPLQTFSKNRSIVFSGMPIFIESSDSEIENLLSFWTQKLKAEKHICNSEQRMKIHIAAVFASNFVNYLLSQAEIWLKENRLNMDILKPLISETIQKALKQGAINSQTGPAARQDHSTIEKHIQTLENAPDLKNLYSFVTESIVRFYTKK
jgi:predicted short-subunit dehydrogenase-like oxidoreductase (DUF2520 family)